MHYYLPSTLRPASSSPLMSSEQDGEFREVVITENPSHKLEVYEFTAGPLTASVYHSPWREHRVTVSSKDIAYLFGPCPRGPKAALITFMQCGEKHLAELMDELDNAFIPYRYDYQVNREELITREPIVPLG